MSQRMGIFEWIQRELNPRPCNSEEFIYDDMESQSGRCLPIIYTPFDPSNMTHWADRGSLYDFLYSVKGEGKRILDFGPGDGWPSLIIAPYAAEIVGVDGSQRRVQTCTDNARRMGITNTRFLCVPPGSLLPFEAGSFDGIMAASSIEQSLDPRATLAELLRVLRPGGYLRIGYEALSRYRGGHESDLWISGFDNKSCRLILFDRDILHERVQQYGLTLAKSKQELCEWISGECAELSFAKLEVKHIKTLLPALIDARVCTTSHPSGETWVRWLHELGPYQVAPTHNGSEFAGQLFKAIPEAERPVDLMGVDRIVAPVVKVAVTLPAPVNTDPMITVMKS